MWNKKSPKKPEANTILVLLFYRERYTSFVFYKSPRKREPKAMVALVPPREYSEKSGKEKVKKSKRAR